MRIKSAIFSDPRKGLQWQFVLLLLPLQSCLSVALWPNSGCACLLLWKVSNNHIMLQRERSENLDSNSKKNEETFDI